MDEKNEIVMVGGGICGLATALALHRKGIRSVVVEKAEKLRAEGAGIIVHQNGWRALQQLGVASSLLKTSLPLRPGQFISIQNGSRTEMRSGKGELRCLRRSVLMKELAENLPAGTLQFGRKVVSVKLDPLTTYPILHLHDGTILNPKVVIGCDGINSVIAEKVGLKSTRKLARCSIRGVTNYENGHSFPHEFSVFTTNNVELGVLPMTHHSVYWFITRKSSHQDEVISRDEELIRETAVETTKSYPEELREMVKKSDTLSFHMTQLRYRAPWELLRTNMRKGTIMVAGDALHAMGPFLGQGGSAALEDAVVLASCLSRKLREGGGAYLTRLALEEAIDAYAQERRMRVFWLTFHTFLVGTMLDSSSPVQFLCLLLLLFFFKDPAWHVHYTCPGF